MKRWSMGIVCAAICAASWAADYPAPREASWVVRDFRFQSGEVLPEPAQE